MRRYLLHASCLALAIELASPAMAQLYCVDQTQSRMNFSSNPDNSIPDDDSEKDFVAADFNSDGRTDLVVVRKTPFELEDAERYALLLMNEGGVLVDRTGQLAAAFQSHHTNARDVEAADVDGDGWLDIVIATTGNTAPALFRNRGTSGGIWLGFEDESDWIGSISSTEEMNFGSVSVGDIVGTNGVPGSDDEPDLFFAAYTPVNTTIDWYDGINNVIMANQGDATFDDVSSSHTFPPYNPALHQTNKPFIQSTLAETAKGVDSKIVNLDDDAALEVLKISTRDGSTNTLFSCDQKGADVSGGFPHNGTHFHCYRVNDVTNGYFVSPGNLNSDNYTDLYVVQDGQDTVLLGPVSGENFDDVKPVDSESRAAQIGGQSALGDIDNDGDLDAGVTALDVEITSCNDLDPGEREFSLLLNDGDGDMTEAEVTGAEIHLPAWDVAFMDVDGDSHPEIVMGLCEGWRVFECPPPCPATSECSGCGTGQNKCTPTGSSSEQDLGIQACRQPNGDVFSCNGTNVKLVTTQCTRCACCTGSPTCTCPPTCAPQKELACGAEEG